MRKVTTPPRNVQGSDADRAEGGLDVERAFADLGGASARMHQEAEAVAEANAADVAARQNRAAPGGKGGHAQE